MAKTYVNFILRVDVERTLLLVVRRHDVLERKVREDREEHDRQSGDEWIDERGLLNAEWAGEVLASGEQTQQHNASEQASQRPDLLPWDYDLCLLLRLGFLLWQETPLSNPINQGKERPSKEVIPPSTTWSVAPAG